jgi:DNA recombination protein RmuC
MMLSGTILAILAGAALIALALYLGLRARPSQALPPPSAPDLGAELERLRAAILEAQSIQRRELSGAVAQSQQGITTALVQQLGQLGDSNAQRLEALRATVDARLKELQADNAGKLEEMRKTVDEKLQSTLEQRLGHSFKQVSDWLEQLNKGLGEMRSLAVGVGDLKRLMGNVKTRGILAEGHLHALLEQVLTPEQYARNVATRAGSSERVEFAIRMPGSVDGQP